MMLGMHEMFANVFHVIEPDCFGTRALVPSFRMPIAIEGDVQF